MATREVTSCINIASPFCNGPARRNPTQNIAATCGRFHTIILQEASDHVPHITDQFIAYTGNTDLAILLNKDIFEPNPAVLAFYEASTSKDTWRMVILIVRGLLRRSSLSGTPTATFCSVHKNSIVAKKRDASTDLLRRLHGYLHQHNVDFIVGDFNMSAFSTVGDVFSNLEFAAPGNSLLCGLGGLDDTCRTSTTTPSLASDPVIKQLTFLFPQSPHHQPTWPRQHHAQ